MNTKLKFPMFTAVFERDLYLSDIEKHSDHEFKQIAFESTNLTADKAKEVLDYQNGRYGEGAVCMVLPFSNRVHVLDWISKEVEYEATFLQFGIDFEEFENGGAGYSTAICLKDDGSLINQPVALVKFINQAGSAE